MLSPNLVRRFVQQSVSTRVGGDYCPGSSKKIWMDAGRRILKEVATRLGLSTSQYEVRLCKGGPAVSGEIILHSDNLYVCMLQSCTGNQFYYRKCDGRKDYVGKGNNWMRFEDLLDLDRAVERFRKVMNCERCPAGPVYGHHNCLPGL